MKKLIIRFAFLSLGVLYGEYAIADITLQVVNNAPNNKSCIYEADSISLFYPPGNQQKPMPAGSSATITVPKTFGQHNFGVQDNGWYWRQDPSSGQNPDNAGMQVIVSVSNNCSVTTAQSWAGAGTPDARKILSVSGKPGVAPINCIITISKQSGGMCVTKNCCGPGTGSGSCIALGINPGETSC